MPALIVIASVAKQSGATTRLWIASPELVEGVSLLAMTAIIFTRGY
jgi:hypothetical protein